MGRKSVLSSINLISAGDMSGDITSSSVSTQYMDNIGIIIEWNGTSPSGSIIIQVQNGSSAWSDLDFGTPIAITGNTGNHNINISLVPFEHLRVFYDRTSGIGSLNVSLAAKVVGA